MTTHSPAPAPTPNPPHVIAGLAIATIGIGLFALALGWFPALGVFALPIGAVAIGIGVVGFVVARSRAQYGMGLPIVGVLIAALAILIAFFLAGGSLGKIRQGFDQYQQMKKTLDQPSHGASTGSSAAR